MPARRLSAQLRSLAYQTRNTGRKVVKRTLVAEENDLAVDLAAQLQTLGDLAHFCFADFFATDKDLDLADAGEHRIAISLINEVARAHAMGVLNRGVDVVSESEFNR